MWKYLLMSLCAIMITSGQVSADEKLYLKYLKKLDKHMEHMRSLEMEIRSVVDSVLSMGASEDKAQELEQMKTALTIAKNRFRAESEILVNVDISDLNKEIVGYTFMLLKYTQMSKDLIREGVQGRFDHVEMGELRDEFELKLETIDENIKMEKSQLEDMYSQSSKFNFPVQWILLCIGVLIGAAFLVSK